MKSDQIARRLAVLKQSNQIDLKITVKELISFGRFPHSKGRINKKDEEIIDLVFETKNPEKTTRVVSGHGLYLISVTY